MKINTFPVSVLPLSASRKVNSLGTSSVWEFSIAQKDGKVVEMEAGRFRRYATNTRWDALKRRVVEAEGTRQKKLVHAFALLARNVGYVAHTADLHSGSQVSVRPFA